LLPVKENRASRQTPIRDSPYSDSVKKMAYGP